MLTLLTAILCWLVALAIEFLILTPFFLRNSVGEVASPQRILNWFSIRGHVFIASLLAAIKTGARMQNQLRILCGVATSPTEFQRKKGVSIKKSTARATSQQRVAVSSVSIATKGCARYCISML